MSYLQQLVSDDVLVCQTVDERERVVHGHSYVGTQLPQQGPKVCVPERLHSGHDANVCVNEIQSDSDHTSGSLDVRGVSFSGREILSWCVFVSCVV